MKRDRREERPSLEMIERLDELVCRLEDLRVTVVGDLMLDEYRLGVVERVSPEAPVPIVRVEQTRTALGGAANVACAVLALGAKCELVAATGTDREGARVLELLAESGLSDRFIVRTPERATTHKLRVVARGEQMLRLDREECGPFDGSAAADLRAHALACAAEANVLILQDYDKGMFADGLGGLLIRDARNRGNAAPALPCAETSTSRGLNPFVVADPKSEFERFRGATLLKPNWPEAEAADGCGATSVAGESRATPDAGDDRDARRALLEKLQREFGVSEVVVTRGARGMSALEGNGQFADVPTQAALVFDVQGAGDTSVATLALCRAAGATLVEACIVANAASRIAVEKAGTAVVTAVELRRVLPDMVAAFARSSERVNEKMNEEQA